MRGKNMEKETKKEKKKNPHQESKKSYYTFLSGFPILGKDTLVCEQLFKLMKDWHSYYLVAPSSIPEDAVYLSEKVSRFQVLDLSLSSTT